MADQLALDGIDPSSPPTDRLFFGIFPSPHVSTSLGNLAGNLRRQHALNGRPLANDRFHVTLHLVGDYVGLPQRVVEEAKSAAAAVVAPPFQITFDRAASFSRKLRNRPFVLLGGEGVSAAIAFQRSLLAALQRVGLMPRSEYSFTPHVTLLYDDANVLEHPVDPVSWTVREFVLIHSLLGKTRHLPLARWALQD